MNAPPTALSGLSIPEVLHRAVASAPETTALVCGDRSVTYAELEGLSRRITGAIRSAGGEPGHRIGVWMHNGIGGAAALFGAAALGTVVPIHTAYTRREVEDVLQRAGVSVLLTEARLADREPADLPLSCEVVTVDDDGAPSMEARVDGSDVPVPRPEELGMIQFTSGTTSVSKGVMLTGAQLVRNASELARRLEVRPGDRYASAMPLYHIGGSVLTLVLCAASMATAVTLRRFEAGHLLAAMAREGCTHLFAVEAMVIGMLDLPDFARHDLHELRVAFIGGRPQVIDEAGSRMRARLVNRYGLTEASGNVTTTLATDTRDVIRSTMGIPLPGIELRITDPESSTPMQPGAPGRIEVKGWAVAAGYLDDPASTREAFGEDGWLRTGDMGHLDESGRLVFLHRIGDVLRVGSENVAAVEIETVLNQHSAVLEAAVVGVPHRLLGVVPVAFIRPRSDPPPDLTHSLVEHCSGRLASFKVPRTVILLEENDWPRSNNGRPQKELLQRMAVAAAEAPSR